MWGVGRGRQEIKDKHKKAQLNNRHNTHKANYDILKLKKMERPASFTWIKADSGFIGW